jgi:predicted transcriptional regulator
VQKALQDALHQFEEWLRMLPKETASDLQELFRLHNEAEDDAARAEIAATVKELLVPQSLIVKMENAYRVDVEDAAIRKRLNDYRRSVGAAIRRHREAKSFTQPQLAELANLPQSHISRLETGVHVPTHATVERIAKALEVCPSQLDPGFDSVHFNDD